MSTHELLNTLYVTLPDVYLRLDNDTVRVEREQETLLRVPLHHLQGIVVFGHTLVSPGLIHRCAEDGRMLTWLDRFGRFKARVGAPVSGNVLLRMAQFEAHRDPVRCAMLARSFVAGKLQNARSNLLRSARDLEGESSKRLRDAAKRIATGIERLPHEDKIDTLRGIEGAAANAYFDAFSEMIRTDDPAFVFEKRTRRPPLDPINALLSFLYTLLVEDCRTALESVGLDPQVGFLHVLRPGRPALALDLSEEFRAILADRLAVTLINRRQLTADDFTVQPGGAVLMSDDARKRLLTAYQERKQVEVEHPAVRSKVPLGLIPHLQARLLARTVRGELEVYPPYLHR